MTHTGWYPPCAIGRKKPGAPRCIDLDQPGFNTEQLATHMLVPVVFARPQPELMCRAVVSPEANEKRAVRHLTEVRRAACNPIAHAGRISLFVVRMTLLGYAVRVQPFSHHLAALASSCNRGATIRRIREQNPCEHHRRRSGWSGAGAGAEARRGCIRRVRGGQDAQLAATGLSHPDRRRGSTGPGANAPPELYDLFRGTVSTTATSGRFLTPGLLPAPGRKPDSWRSADSVDEGAQGAGT